MPSEIAIPFRLDSSGRISVTSNPNDQIRQHVLSLINTAPTERAVLIDYGVPLEEEVFENDDVAVATDLQNTISQAFKTWEPGIGLLGVTMDQDRTGNGTAAVNVKYLRTDAPDTAVRGDGYNTAVIRVGGHVDEVVRS